MRLCFQINPLIDSPVSKKLIKKVCEKYGWQHKELADICGVSYRTVQGWSWGRKPSGPSKIILKLLSQ